MAVNLISGKKGIFFSILSIFILIALFLVFSSVFESSTLADQQDIEDEKIIISNNQFAFLKTAYIPNALKTAARLSIISYVAEINNNDDFIIDCFDDDDCDDDSEELEQLKTDLINSIVFGNRAGNVGYDEKVGIFEDVRYENFTLIDQLNSVRQIMRDHFQSNIYFVYDDNKIWPVDPVADRFDLSNGDFVNYLETDLVNSMSINMTTAFILSVNISLSFIYNASGDKVSWVGDDQVFRTQVSLEGIVDPLYMIYTKKLFGDNNQYNYTFRSYDLIGQSYSSETLADLYVSQKYFVAPQKGPSILQRMVNSNHSHYSFGVASLVNLYNVIPDSGDRKTLVEGMGPLFGTSAPWYSRSGADYLFFFEIPYICQDAPEFGRQLYFVEEWEATDTDSVGVIPDYYEGNSYFNIDPFYVDGVLEFRRVYYGGSSDSGIECEYSPSCISDGTCP